MVFTEINNQKSQLMKKLNLIQKLMSLLIIVAVMVSCKKEYQSIAPVETDLSNKANVKFYNGIVNSNRTYIYAELVPLNGATVAYGAVFPALSPSYTALNPGSVNIVMRDTLVPTTQFPLNFFAELEKGKYYTVFAYDSLNSPKRKVVLDNIQQFGDTTARIRFANFPFSSAAIPNVDVYSAKRKENIFTNISTTTVTDFIPYASALSDTLFVRQTGTTTNLTQLNGLIPTAKRSYTVIFRGSYRVTSGTAARTLSSFLTF
jgi:hypothetical protein